MIVKQVKVMWAAPRAIVAFGNDGKVTQTTGMVVIKSFVIFWKMVVQTTSTIFNIRF